MTIPSCCAGHVHLLALQGFSLRSCGGGSVSPSCPHHPGRLFGRHRLFPVLLRSLRRPRPTERAAGGGRPGHHLPSALLPTHFGKRGEEGLCYDGVRVVLRRGTVRIKQLETLREIYSVVELFSPSIPGRGFIMAVYCIAR